MSILSKFNILACNQKYARKNHLKINKTLCKAKNWGDLGTEINFWKIEMITVKESFQNNGTTVCLLLENPKSFIIIISIKKSFRW